MNTSRLQVSLVSVLGVLALVATSGLSFTGAILNDSESSAVNTLTSWISEVLGEVWIQTSKTDFELGYGEGIDTYTVPGEVILDSSIDFFAFRGGGTTTFWRFDSVNNEWTTMAPAPGAVGSGGGLAFPRLSQNQLDNRYIYGLRGNNSQDFWRYDIVTNTWTAMASTPGPVNAGGYIRTGPGGDIYACQGGTTAFWRYAVASNTWEVLPSTSGTTGAGASLVWDGGDCIYGTLGGGSNKFLCYSVSAGSWSDAPEDVPAGIGAGAELSHVNTTFTFPDGTTSSYNCIYATRGGGSNAFYSYDLATESWSVRPDAPAPITAGGTIRWNGLGHIYVFQGGSTTMWRYNILRDAWPTALAPMTNPVTDGGALCVDASGDYVYAFQGGGSDMFWCYHATLDFNWFEMASAPAGVDAGAALLCTGNFIYALRGDGSTDFWRYNVSGDTWESRAATPAAVGYGGALTYDGTYIYALRGGGQTGFWRYDISADSWSTLTSTPASVNYGGALAYKSSTNIVYALRGGNTRDFWGYDVATGLWETLRDVPDPVGYGGALVNVPGNFLNAMRGNNSSDFYRFNTRTGRFGRWQDRDDTPDAVGTGDIGGGALAYNGDGWIYALRGTNTTDLWRYIVVVNSWLIAAEQVPAATGAGAKLVGPVPSYELTGWQESDVFDSGAPGTQWDTMEWDEYLSAGTDITFQIRASDTLFYVGDYESPQPAWVTVGGTSPSTLTGIAGQYVQWRATLTSTNTFVTPELEEVRVYYTLT